MKFSMRTKLMASFAATALVCVILIGLFSNVMLEKHFKEYVLQNQSQENQEIVEHSGSIAGRDGKSDLYNELDLHFLKTLNRVFLWVGLFSLMLSILVGFVLSDRISRPIVRVIKKAQLIASGTYGERSLENTSTREIRDLTQTINDLAVTLEDQEKLRKRLTADVAHELRTPLATLHSHMEAMMDGVWEPTTERLASCDEEITRIIRLVSDLEKLAHYESENLKLNKSYFKAKDFLEQVVQSFEVEFLKLGVKSVIECDEAAFIADRDKLSQVFINLISNALRFTPYGGIIKISVQEDHDQINVVVMDTGQGISKQDLPHIFERFYRADVSRNRKTGGAGIGLSLVKSIVEAHEGTIEVSSEPNQGTQFTMNFPS